MRYPPGMRLGYPAGAPLPPSRHARTRRRAGAAAALFSLAAAATAAGPRQIAGETPRPAVYGERVDVEIVNVDVWVVDRHGDPVTGLEAESFEIVHDGQPVTISHFVEVRGGLVAARRGAAEIGAGAQPASELAAPGHLVVYFDNSRLHPNNSKRLVRGLEKLLATRMFEPERVLIVRQDRSLAVEAPFGSTDQELLQALRRLERGGAAGLDLETETRQALDAIRSAWEQSQDTLGSASGGIALVPNVANPTGEPGGAGGRTLGGPGSPGGPDACGSFVNQVEPILDSWVRSRGHRVAITLSNLTDAASFLAGLPGIKTLLYLSDGLDTQPGAALATYAAGLCPGAGMELLSNAASEEMSDRFLELTRHANTNRVTIHSVQASGLQSPAATSASSDRGVRGGGSQRSSGTFAARKRAAEQDGLRLVAGETGGRTIVDRNELGPELIGIGEASRTYYSLAYEPPVASAAGGPRSHRIEVKLADGSLVARYRRGYREKGPEQWLTERIEGALNLGITSNPLAVRLGAGAIRPGAGEGRQLPLHVMVPVERLTFLPRDAERVAEIKLKVLARSLATDLLVLREKSYQVKGAPEAGGSVDLPILLELAPGAYLAAIGVQDQVSREASFVSTALEID